ncbi:MAG: carbohydrate binding domain-containing protein, partial [Clostridiales bacterium]|nr:carbohydrate binding domain-containing protein [Clostridiales bacterium]
MKICISQEGKSPVGEGIGLFIEDINYALDGGLYAEMLENRNFEAKEAHGERDHYIVDFDGGYAWEAYPRGASVGMKLKTDRALFSENPHYMRVTVSEGGNGIKNKAYDGVFLEAKEKYKVSFYARSYDYKDKATVGVYQGDAPVIEKTLKLKADGKWHKYAFVLKAKQSAEKADFAFRLLKAGTVHVDCFSLMPENAVLGIFRRDLVAHMKDLKPAFLRFPGGCVVEGNNLENRYMWKNTIGQVERRKHNW